MKKKLSYLSPGDLVRYVIDSDKPSSLVIPRDENPVGLVINVESILVGTDPKCQAYMETIDVIWSIPSWNNEKGLSTECRSDLFLIQRIDRRKRLLSLDTY